jgi:hypothetical protein
MGLGMGCAVDERDLSADQAEAGTPSGDARLDHQAAGGSTGTGGGSHTGGGSGSGGASTGSGGGPGGDGGSTGTGGSEQAGAGGAGTGGDTGGDGGSTGTGGAGTGGSVPTCVPTGTENCTNGMDDDCNGDTDCADDACAKVPSCLTLPTGAILGARISAGGSCPSGYSGGVTHIHKDIDQGSCSGCGCSVGPTVCSTSITGFEQADECVTDTNRIIEYGGGDLSTAPDGIKCLHYMEGVTSPTYFRSKLIIDRPDCQPTGSPQKKSASFKTSADFCQLPPGTNPPSGSTAKGCMLLTGARSCPAGYGTPDSSWYGSLSDTRTCKACSCEIVTYGDCNSVKIGSWRGDNSDNGDYCTFSSGPDATYDLGARDCMTPLWVPTFKLVGGSPKKSTCTGQTGFAGGGGITPKDQYTLCCP